MTRRRILTVTALAVTGIAAASVADWPAKLIWNATASAPIGFYTVRPADALDVPELVAVMPPEPLERFMVERGYVGRTSRRHCRSGDAREEHHNDGREERELHLPTKGRGSEGAELVCG